VFCCFNNNWKILPDLFDCWMDILRSVDGGVLWLFEDNPTAARNLRKEAAKRDVDPGRLVFAQAMANSEHLARYRYADLFLDTFPYNAHTTASDALWVGVPVLTLQGQSFASRVASSLLVNVGLPELVTRSMDEYRALAIGFANHPERLEALKSRLAENRSTAPLFDTPLYTRHIESAYQTACNHYYATQKNDEN
jgi:predicted O-linked N-acetylglucosamine transferase (SPINDLY family)